MLSDTRSALCILPIHHIDVSYAILQTTSVFSISIHGLSNPDGIVRLFLRRLRPIELNVDGFVRVRRVVDVVAVVVIDGCRYEYKSEIFFVPFGARAYRWKTRDT